MDERRLPEKLRGNWIWHREGEDLESYVFFRHQFTLDETPARADLWIAANTLFHLTVNGRHLGFGPPACPTQHAYVMHFDVSHLMLTGSNVVAVQVHNTQVSRFAARRRAGGMWCQIDCDGVPAACTNAEWNCWQADCFLKNRPRVSLAAGFTETLDLRLYPQGWDQTGAAHAGWEAPRVVTPAERFPQALEPILGPPVLFAQQPFRSVPVSGVWEPVQGITYVSFAKPCADTGPGCYAAEAYLHWDADAEVAFELFADDPCRIFVNDVCVKQQGIIPLPPRADLQLFRPPCYRQAGADEPDGTMGLHKGWNRILVVQQVDTHSCGLTIVFPEIPCARIRLVREPRKGALPGWMLAGPLRVPISRLSGHLELATAERTPYVPAAQDPVDESAFLMACGFGPLSEGSGRPPDVITMEEGEYTVLDMGQTVFGCPEFSIAGTDGDVVDIACAEQYVAGQVLAWNEGHRNADSLILCDEMHEYRRVAPRGFRYLMLVVRKAADTVTIQDVGVRLRRHEQPHCGAFESSDTQLNRLWAVSRNTLETTVQGHFLNSAAKDTTQFIADAMIQSLAAYHLFGMYELAAKTIEEFAKCQFETGEMPAICPSDMYLHLPDYALMWPVWLRRHMMYTGDGALLDRVIEPLLRLFDFYESRAAREHHVLCDLDQIGDLSFLDHGAIDRAGICTGLNAIYCRSLLAGAWLLDTAGRDADAAELRGRANAIVHLLRELCWDPDRGLFADGWYDDDMSPHYAWQSSLLALYGGVASEEQTETILEALCSEEAPYLPFAKGPESNPYFQYFVLETAFELQRHAWGLAWMRRYWGGMLDQGAMTWWEFFDPDAPVPTFRPYSMCHGYGASPSYFLAAEIVGLRPAAPGFRAAFLQPCLDAAKWLRIVVPTPHGTITVHWIPDDDGLIEIMVDADYPLDLYPRFTVAQSEKVLLRISDTISLPGSRP